eukprot:CAMPEP_0181059460 /NCGR_PEP_ID=MMETSP1070-20121207/21395_1 /TAXON_ID=265543 /ORGANISM="Minutocellus polymorphus, Strain NH13" /LENGTH=43 /DNA_ID= /DNA_START= /DNA_END= /DNA_ORIENTATION=
MTIQIMDHGDRKTSMMDLRMSTTTNDPAVQPKIMTTVRVDRVM